MNNSQLDSTKLLPLEIRGKITDFLDPESKALVSASPAFNKLFSRDPTKSLPADTLQKIVAFLDHKSRAQACATSPAFNKLFTGELLAQFEKSPLFEKAFIARIGKAESDERKCRRIIETVNRSLERGRSLLTDREFPGIFDTDLNDFSYEQREHMGHLIAEKRASTLISFFEKLANLFPAAQDFLTSLPDLQNREKAREIRRWMQENRQEIIQELAVEGRIASVLVEALLLEQEPKIPKEILQLDLLEFSFEFLSGLCELWSDLDHCEPLLEILKNPAFLPLRQDAGLVHKCLKIAFEKANFETIKILQRFEGYRDIPEQDMAQLWASTFQS